ncbi:MAG TPA: hypothetical protein VGC09_13545 [Rhodopila sp.]
MAADPLQTLLAIRRREVEQARMVLATCLATEAAVSQRIGSLDAAARRDCETAAVWTHAHQFLEIAGARLAAARSDRRSLTADLAAAQTSTEQARGYVAATRTAAETVEQLIAEREAARQAEAGKRAQHALDDIVRKRRPPYSGHDQ